MAREKSVSRRDFVRIGCCTAASFGLGAAIGRLNMIQAFAAPPTTGYRALVCIFLFGGNDSNNMIVPNDSAGYLNYATLRANLALPQSTLLPIVAKTGNVPYGLHPQFPGLQSLFGSGQAAVLANVGTLAQPLTHNTSRAAPRCPSISFRIPTNRAKCRRPILTASALPGGEGAPRTNYSR